MPAVRPAIIQQEVTVSDIASSTTAEPAHQPEGPQGFCHMRVSTHAVQAVCAGRRTACTCFCCSTEPLQNCKTVTAPLACNGETCIYTAASTPNTSLAADLV